MRFVAKYALLLLVVIALLVSVAGCSGGSAPAPTAAPAAPTTSAPAVKPTTAPAATTASTATAPAAASTTSAAAAPAAAPMVVDKAKLPKTITLATPSAGSADYNAGTALSKVASDIGPTQVIVQPYAGPAAWVPLMMSANKPEVGIMNAAEAYQAFTGKVAAGPLPEGVEITPPYKTANPNLRLLFMGPELTTGFIVKKDSKFQSVAELKGTTMTWGYKAQVGGFLAHLANLAMAGIKKSDLKTVEIAQVNDGVRALGEGRVDSTAVATATGIVPEVDAQVALRYIDTPDDPSKLKDAQIIMPGCRVATVKGGSSAAVLKDTKMIAFGKAYVSTSAVNDETAYTLVKTWFENYEKLPPMEKVFAAWSAKQFVSESATIPYHNGAIAYFKEKGLWTPQMEKNQEMLLKGQLPALQ